MPQPILLRKRSPACEPHFGRLYRTHQTLQQLSCSLLRPTRITSWGGTSQARCNLITSVVNLDPSQARESWSTSQVHNWTRTLTIQPGEKRTRSLLTTLLKTNYYFNSSRSFWEIEIKSFNLSEIKPVSYGYGTRTCLNMCYRWFRQLGRVASNRVALGKLTVFMLAKIC